MPLPLPNPGWRMVGGPHPDRALVAGPIEVQGREIAVFDAEARPTAAEKAGADLIVAAFVRRLDAVERRLTVLARGPRRDGLTEPDPASGERWEAGQVWAHLAEFLSYWIAQCQYLLATPSADPVPFGRTKADPGRIGAIERNRREPPSVLLQSVSAGVAELRSFLISLAPEAWEARGRHPTLGVMDLRRIVDEFMVGHLEQHAEQLERLPEETSA